MTEVTPIESGNNAMSIARLAQAFGHSRETVAKRLAARNVQPSGQRNGWPVYSLKEAATALLLMQGPADPNDPEQMRPTDRRAYWQSENERLKFEQENGRLVLDDEVREQMADIARVVNRSLLTLADNMERDLRCDPLFVEYIERKVRAVLQQIADQLAMDDEQPTHTVEA